MRLSADELVEIRKSLEEFVGLRLTDVWDAWGRIFEFGEQIPFVNRDGEEVSRAKRSLKSLNRFEIEGLAKGILNSDNYSDDERNLSAAAIEFLDRMNRGEFTVESICVSELGEVRIELASRVTLRILGRTVGWMGDGESIDDCWFLRVPGRSMLLSESGMNTGSHLDFELSDQELELLRGDLGLMLHSHLSEFRTCDGLEMRLSSEKHEFEITSQKFDVKQIRIEGKRPARDNSTWDEKFHEGLILDRVVADRFGTVAFWFGELMIQVDAKKGWTLKSGEFEYKATSSGLVRNSC